MTRRYKPPAKFDSEKFNPAFVHFKHAIQTSNLYQQRINDALAKHGDHGPLISGVIRDHFPKQTKDVLRKLAREKSEQIDKGFAAKPNRVHEKTMQELYQVAKKMFSRKPFGKNPVTKRYFLYDVLNDYSIAKVDGKSDFGTLAHAEKRAVKDNRGEKVLWSTADIPPRTHKHYYGRNKHKELIYLISTHGLLKNPKLRQKGNTKVTEGPGKQLVVRLHATDILQILANGDVQLDSGGWKTVTTKRRMNEAADELGLGFNVYAKKGEWFVESHEVGIIPFFDGMIFPATKKKDPKARPPKISSRDGYAIALITTGEFFWRGRGGWAAPPEPYTSFDKANAAVHRIAKSHGNLYESDDFEIHSVPLSEFKKAGTWTRQKKEFLDKKRGKPHLQHDWYVAQLFQSQKRQDTGLRKSLDYNMQKMSKFHRDAIMKDFREVWKNYYASQSGMRRATTKNPKRRKYLAFRCSGPKVYYLHINIARASGFEWKLQKRGALRFDTADVASDVLQDFMDTGRAHSKSKFGVVYSSTTEKAIRAFCKKKRGKV